MSNTEFPLDYGAELVLRYRMSGLTRKEFAAQSGIAVSTLDYCLRRERSVSSAAAVRPNRILPVDLVACEKACSRATVSALYLSTKLDS